MLFPDSGYVIVVNVSELTGAGTDTVIGTVTVIV